MTHRHCQVQDKTIASAKSPQQLDATTTTTMKVRALWFILLPFAIAALWTFHDYLISARHSPSGVSPKDLDVPEQRYELADKPENVSFSPLKILCHATTQVEDPYREEDLLPVAMDIFQKRGVVLFTFINDAYLEFAFSWLCNTEAMADVHQHVLFVVTDLRSGRCLQKLWPDVSVVALNASRYSGDQTYSQAGYVRVMVERTRYILRLLESKVRLLLFEVDCVWLTNALPHLLNRKPDADIIATKVKNRTAGGFLLLSPTQRTLGLWRELTSQMDRLYEQLEHKRDSYVISWRLNDQEFLAALIEKRFGGIEVVHLPSQLFPDGNWYRKPAQKRIAKPLPIIINNNFIKGNAKKKKRAKSFGHWFFNTDGGGDLRAFCNASAVHAVVYP